MKINGPSMTVTNDLRIEQVRAENDEVVYRLTMTAPTFNLSGLIPVLTFPC